MRRSGWVRIWPRAFLAARAWRKRAQVLRNSVSVGRGLARRYTARMPRGTWVFLLAIAWAPVAGAAECANACWLDPGQLCIGSAGGRGFARLAEAGKPVQLVVERHPGSCGTLAPVDPARVQARIADQPG